MYRVSRKQLYNLHGIKKLNVVTVKNNTARPKPYQYGYSTDHRLCPRWL